MWSTQIGRAELSNNFQYNYLENELWETEYRAYQRVAKNKRKEHKYIVTHEGKAFEKLMAFGIEKKLITPEDFKIIKEEGIQKWIEHIVWFAYGSLVIARHSPLSEDGFNILQRFTGVFEQTYTRFLDLSEKLSPQKVVDILNGLFSKFDDLTDKYQLEKIKTIGDAYMVASGVPKEKEHHALALFQFAQEMLKAIQIFNQVHQLTLAIRIGISSGPVVAGVIGKKKFAYDLWGDTVNTAARMEANGQADCIQISPTTYAILKERFEFKKIPNVSIKGKGMMDVYLWTP